ncbi:MAG: c-type cytochrome domain-containing protein [Roseimicrobium sp.]
MKIQRTLLLAAAGLSAMSLYAQTPAAADKVDFEKQVLPIFEAKCMKCHQTEHTDATGKLKKPKGGLVMDTAEGLKKGGKEHGDKNIVAGKAADSRLYVVTTLAISDDAFMPPEGKADPLTDAEKEVLKKWIDQGADFGAWTKKAPK